MLFCRKLSTIFALIFSRSQDSFGLKNQSISELIVDTKNERLNIINTVFKFLVAIALSSILGNKSENADEAEDKIS